MTKKSSIAKSNVKWAYIFITPGIVGFLLFSLGPMLFSLYVSLHEWDIIHPMKAVGFANYTAAFGDPTGWRSLKATAYYTLLSVPMVIVVTFLVALLLNLSVKMISLVRTIFYIPSIIPLVATSAIWMYIYNPTYGLLNGILRNLHLPTQQFIAGINSVVVCLAVMAVWCAGNTVIIYLAGLQGISAELYEAAKIDGARAHQSFRHITVPIMTPIIFYNLIMTTIGCLQVFIQPYIMTDGGPANASLFFSLLIYRNAFKYGRMGYAAALSWILFVVVGALTALIFASSNKWVYYETGGAKS